MTRLSARASAGSSTTTASSSPRSRRQPMRSHSCKRPPSTAWCSTSACPICSGYELLEKMATARTLLLPAGDRLHRPRALARGGGAARRYSKSIIIKDARSPERLLDEVTLFLHQVESKLPAERQQMLRTARDREAAFEGRRILVVEDDVRNIFALSSVLEPQGCEGGDRAERTGGARDAGSRRRRSGAASIWS